MDQKEQREEREKLNGQQRETCALVRVGS